MGTAAAVQALLALFAALEPSLASILLLLLGRLKDQLASETDQAIFLNIAGKVVVSFAADTLLTPAEQRIGARAAIINALADLAAFNVAPPPLGVIDEMLLHAFPD